MVLTACVTNMKVTTEREDFRSMDIGELEIKINSFRRELFSLRLNASTAHVKDYSQFGRLRKRIARALTCLHNKQRQV